MYKMVEAVDSINGIKQSGTVMIGSLLGTEISNISNSTDPMLSSNDNPATPSQYNYIIPIKVVVIIFSIILFVTLIGNSIVIFIVVKKRRIETFTNWLILNLSISDLLVALICITIEIPIEIRGGISIYGSIYCLLFHPIQTITIYVSVFTLLSLSVSRYWAIIYPFRRQPTIFVAKVLIGVIWLASVAIVIPYVNVSKYEKEKCVEDWTPKEQRWYTVMVFTSQFVLPIIIISIAYASIIYDLSCKKETGSTTPANTDKRRESKKVVRLLLLITITFVICILPYHIIGLIIEFSGSKFEYVNDIVLASYVILYLNSALNPILYNVFNEDFREAFKELYINRESNNNSRTTTVLSNIDLSTSRTSSVITTLA